MKTNLFLLFTLVSTFCLSQNPWNEYAKLFCDPNSVYRDYYNNGQLRLIFTLKEGNLDGDYLGYYENGNIQDSSHFDNGFLHGNCKSYNKKGQLILEEDYKHDTLLSYRGLYYYKNGKIEAEEKLFFDIGSLKKNPFIKISTHTEGSDPSINYNKDLSISTMKSHGKQLEYFKNGKLKSEGFTVNNLFEGSYKWYNKDGTLAGEGSYQNDKKEGTFIYYSKTGQITKIETWKVGKLIKTEKKNGL